MPLGFGAEPGHGAHPVARGCKILQDEATPGTWGLISLSPAADAFVLGGRTQKSALAYWEMGVPSAP